MQGVAVKYTLTGFFIQNHQRFTTDDNLNLVSFSELIRSAFYGFIQIVDTFNEGYLIDPSGNSELANIFLSDTRLEFDKYYQRRPQTDVYCIHYDLRKVRENIFEGYYSSPSTGFGSVRVLVDVMDEEFHQVSQNLTDIGFQHCNLDFYGFAFDGTVKETVAEIILESTDNFDLCFALQQSFYLECDNNAENGINYQRYEQKYMNEFYGVIVENMADLVAAINDKLTGFGYSGQITQIATGEFSVTHDLIQTIQDIITKPSSATNLNTNG